MYPFEVIIAFSVPWLNGGIIYEQAFRVVGVCLVELPALDHHLQIVV